MHGSIVVLLDGSNSGERAIPYAFSIARRADLPVHLVHVHENLAPIYAAALASGGDATAWDDRPNEQEYLQSLQEQTRFDQDLEIRTALINGDVSEALDQYLLDVNASLIVMAPDDQGSLERFLLGNAADRAQRNPLPPLLLVHSSEDAGDDIHVHLDHLLLPLETVSDSEGILEPALELGSLFGGECTLFHVADDAGCVDYAPRVTTGACDSGDPESRAEFENLASHLREKGTRVSVRVVENPYPADGVLEAANSGNADWIAISSQCRPRLSQLPFGSTANKIIHGANVPVFVYAAQPN
jgi:nucleotide-binding universal stress UspA family protein